jgi:hypothetical protein
MPSNPFIISPAAASRLTFTTEPPTAIAVHSSFTTTVQVTDKYGNPVPNAGVTLTPSAGTLSGTRKVTADATGAASFSGLSLNKIGVNFLLTASASGAASIKSTRFNVTSVPVATLSFMTVPRSTTAGASLGAVTVQALDANGFPVVSAPITISISSGTLYGTLTGVTNSLGLATFSKLSERLAGNYTLTATSESMTAQSAPFTISAAAAILKFMTQPNSTLAGVPLVEIDVRAADKYGNVVSGATVHLTLSSVLLSGLTTVTTDTTGQASFTMLWVSTPGKFTIKATSHGATSATSRTFVISPLPEYTTWP